jgi:simple sugar transport system permease protein
MLEIITITIILATPLALAAMGGYTSERSGVINIGLEGMMLMSACATALAAPKFGPVASIGFGIVAATVLALIHWMATQVYRIDHVISGMAVNALGAGGTNYLYGKLSDPSQAGAINHVPVFLFSIAAFLSPAILWAYTRWTKGGLRLLAVGSDPDKARLVGVQPLRVRFFGLLATGVFTGLGGCQLLAYTGNFTDGMTSGRGFIALAALILGGWRPLPTLGACLAFGFFSALRIQFQGAPLFGVKLPEEAWASLPYLVTVIALAGFLGKQRTPAGLGKH